jgi:hypothetical protein
MGERYGRKSRGRRRVGLRRVRAEMKGKRRKFWNRRDMIVGDRE